MTGFANVEVLDGFLGLLNADGLFADINPKQPAQESDVHHVEYFNQERVDVWPGTFLRVTTSSTASCLDGSTFPLLAGEYVISINPQRYPAINIDAGNVLIRKASRRSGPSSALGQVPLFALEVTAPIQDDDDGDEEDEHGINDADDVADGHAGAGAGAGGAGGAGAGGAGGAGGAVGAGGAGGAGAGAAGGAGAGAGAGAAPRLPRKPKTGPKRAMSWQTAVCFVLSILCTGVDIIDVHHYWGLEYSTACRCIS